MSQGQSTYDKPMDEKAPPVQSLELPTVASMTNEAAVLDAERRYRARRKRRAHVFIALGLLAVFWYSRRSESAKPIPRQFVEMKELLPAPQVPSGWPYEGEQTYSECHNAGATAVKDADGTFSAQKNFPAAISTDYGVHSFELIPVLDYKGTVTVSAEQCLGDPPIPSYLYSVNFTMKHPSLDALDLINMCAVHTSSDGSRGVVLGPTWPSMGQVSGPFEVHVDIRIPSCIPSLMSSLKMNLPGLNHTFKALETELKSVQVLSSDSYIANEGLRGRDFEVSARNSPITGFFNVTNGLSLTTSNAPIDVAVEARHEASHWPSDIRIQTSNAELNASLSLINSTTHGNFRVFTTTSNGPTDVTILTSPIDGKLRLDARTSNAPARLAVDPAFEGVYVTHLANAQGIVSVREDVEDPMGLGRARVIETKVQIPTMIMGSAYWGSSKKEDFPNIASIKTSNNVATIVL